MESILLVEDDLNDVDLLRHSLAHINLLNHVDVATSAEVARLYLSASMPALLICDINLPKDNGIDLLHWLRRQPLPLCDLPVIMLSGSADGMHQVRASALRALLFLQKPVAPRELLEALRGLGLLATRVVKGEGFGVVIEKQLR